MMMTSSSSPTDLSHLYGPSTFTAPAPLQLPSDFYASMVMTAAALEAQGVTGESATSLLTMNAAALIAAQTLMSPSWSSGSYPSTPTFSPQMHPQQLSAHHGGGAGMAGGFHPQQQHAGMHHHHQHAFHPQAMLSQQLQQQAAPQVRRYSHNPYAASETSTPTTPSLTSPSFAGAMGEAPVPVGFSTFLPSAFPQHHHIGSGGAEGSSFAAPQTLDSPSAVAYGINEQFAALKGSIAAAACTQRGRHVLIAALRMQHVDKSEAVLAEIVGPAFSTIVADQNGCHVIRALVDFLTEVQSASLIQALPQEALLSLATSSQHSRRILQALCERHRNTAAMQPIVDCIATHATTLAVTQQGCIAVMRVVENATDSQKKQVLMAVRHTLAALTTDPYGNYVVQTLIQNLPRDVASDIIDKAFEGHLVVMACNKFASNVMEKVIQAATPPTRKMILDELCFNQANLQIIVCDGFGNFVLQSIIDTCTTGGEYRKLCDRVRPLLQTSPYGHKIEAKLRSKRFNTH